MRLPRRTVWSLLSAIMATSLILRYPSSPHEVGVDSFFIHNLAANLSARGEAPWTLNVLSYAGLFPMSYPAAGPFLVSELQQLSGSSVEVSILLVSMIAGSLGVLTSFMLAREFRRDDVFCLFVSFVYALAPRFLTFELWTASSRGLFMSLLPVFIWALLRLNRALTPKYVATTAALFLFMTTVHRLAALLVVILIAFFAAIVMLYLLRIMRLRQPQLLLSRKYRLASPYLALLGFALVTVFTLLGTNVLAQYSTGELASGTSPGVELLNLTVSLARSVGLSLALALAGLFVLVRIRNKGIGEAFFLVAFLALTPTLFLRFYTGFYILPFVAVLGALGVKGIMGAHPGMLRKIGVTAVVIGVLASSTGILTYEISQTPVLSEETYSTSLYVRATPGSNIIISNDGLLGVQVASISLDPYLPVGGASTLQQSPELLIYGFYTADQVETETQQVPIWNLTLDGGGFWDTPSIHAADDWSGLLQSTYPISNAVFARYHPTLLIVTKTEGASFNAFGRQYESTYVLSAEAQTYQIYESATDAIWYVGEP